MKWTIKEIITNAKAIILGDITMATSAKNYTDEMVASMTEAYQANPSRAVSYTHLTLPTNVAV